MAKKMMITDILLSLTLAGIILVKAPAFVKELKQYIAPQPTPQPLIYNPDHDTVVTDSGRISAVENFLRQEQNDHLSDRLVRIEEKQTIMQLTLIPIALFLFTHTFEIIWRNVRFKKSDEP